MEWCSRRREQPARRSEWDESRSAGNPHRARVAPRRRVGSDVASPSLRRIRTGGWYSPASHGTRTRTGLTDPFECSALCLQSPATGTVGSEQPRRRRWGESRCGRRRSRRTAGIGRCGRWTCSRGPNRFQPDRSGSIAPTACRRESSRSRAWAERQRTRTAWSDRGSMDRGHPKGIPVPSR